MDFKIKAEVTHKLEKWEGSNWRNNNVSRQNDKTLIQCQKKNI